MILKCELVEPLFCVMGQPSRSYYLPARATQGIVKQHSHGYILKYLEIFLEIYLIRKIIYLINFARATQGIVNQHSHGYV